MKMLVGIVALMMLFHHFTSWISITLLLSTCSRADEEHHKRIPSGFTGVRGKKSIPDEAYNAEDFDVNSNTVVQQQPSVETQTLPPGNYVIEKRAPSGFFGMRGKKPWNYPQYEYPEELYKRAPMGFVGMRGKKETTDNDNDLSFDEPSKRAPMGFFGMRGKKFWIDSDYPAEAKRVPMGFVGMRGKKDSENPSGYFENDKRAPAGFFGMRGKKHPSGFFGMRGKKYPYEFRGKFVGVRGKKSSEITLPQNYYSDVDRLSDQLDLNQLMLLLTDERNAFDEINQ